MSHNDKNRPAQLWVEKLRQKMKENNMSYHNEAPGVIKERRRVSFNPYQAPAGMLAGAEVVKRQRRVWNPKPFNFPEDSLVQARLDGDLLGMLKKQTERENRQRVEEELNSKKRKQESFINLPSKMYDTVDLPDISLFKRPYAMAPERVPKRLKKHRNMPYDLTLAGLEKTVDFMPPQFSTPKSFVAEPPPPPPKPFSPPASPLRAVAKTPIKQPRGGPSLSNSSLTPTRPPRTYDFEAKRRNMIAICNGVAIAADRALFPQRKSILEMTKTVLRRVQKIFQSDLPPEALTPNIISNANNARKVNTKQRSSKNKENTLLKESQFPLVKQTSKTVGFFDFFQREDTEVKLIF